MLQRYSNWHSAWMLGGLAVSAVWLGPSPFAELGCLSLAWFYIRARPETRWPGAANAVTLGRMLLGYGVIRWMWPDPVWISGAAAVALALDGLDGWIARRRGEASPFGAQLDMETDAFLVALLCLAWYTSGRFGLWVLIPGVLRYAYVVLRACTGSEPVPERRSKAGRWIFFALVGALAAGGVVEPVWSRWLIGAATVAVTASFVPDFALLISTRLAARARHEVA